MDIPEEIHPKHLLLDTNPHNNVDEAKVIASLTSDPSSSSPLQVNVSSQF